MGQRQRVSQRIGTVVVFLSVVLSVVQPILPRPVQAARVPVVAPVAPVMTPAAAPAPRAAQLGQFPLAFIPNRGQSNGAVQFQVQSADGSQLFLTRQKIVFGLPTAPTDRDPTDAPDPQGPGKGRAGKLTYVHLVFAGARPNPSLVGVDVLPGTANYLLGEKAAKWQTNLPTYAGVQYQQLYTGIDVVYAGTSGRVKATYTVAPQANAGQIQWHYPATTVQVDAPSGDLLITPRRGQAGTTPLTLREAAPQAWQLQDGVQQPVAVAYVVAADQSIRFQLGSYDPTRPLIIDPVVDYSSYLGGSGEDQG